MSWKPLVVGVETSPEAARAAAQAVRMAERARTSVHLVHATRDPWASLAAVEPPAEIADFRDAALAGARARVRDELRGAVPDDVLDRMTVAVGRPAAVLADTAERVDAGLIVIGGKLHTTLGRWFGGSTGHSLARMHRWPILVNGPAGGPVRRILVAADLSGAAGAVIAAAEQAATLFDAKLKVITVFEPLPVLPEVPLTIDPSEYYGRAQRVLEEKVWPRITRSDTERVVRHGLPVETILREATDWPADLIVVGSHRRGAVERALLGSVTEGLLNHFPTGLLVIPVPFPVEEAVPKEPAARQAAVAAR